MRRIDVLRTLAMSSALILAISGTACASDEDTGETAEPPGVEAAPPAEPAEEATEETEAPQEQSEEEAAEEEGS